MAEACPTCGLTMSVFHPVHPTQDAEAVRGSASPRVPKDMQACHELAKAISEEWLRMGYSESVPDVWLGPLAHAAARIAMTHSDGLEDDGQWGLFS